MSARASRRSADQTTSAKLLAIATLGAALIMGGCKPDPHIDVAPDGALLVSSEFGVVVISPNRHGHIRLAEEGYLGRFSPDGRKLCWLTFADERSGKAQPAIWVCDRNGSTKRKFVLGKILPVQPVWADNRSIWLALAEPQRRLVRISAASGDVLDEVPLEQWQKATLVAIDGSPVLAGWRRLNLWSASLTVLPAEPADAGATGSPAADQGHAENQQAVSIFPCALRIRYLDRFRSQDLALTINLAAGPVSITKSCVVATGLVLDPFFAWPGRTRLREAKKVAEMWGKAAFAWRIYAMDRYSGSVTVLATLRSTSTPEPIVSPDGRWVLVRYTQTTISDESDERNALYRVELLSTDGKVHQRLGDALRLVPCWLSEEEFAFIPARRRPPKDADQKRWIRRQPLEVYRIVGDRAEYAETIGPVLSW